MNPIKQLLNQTAIYGVSSIVGRLLNYFLVPLYTYLFEKGEYGIVTEMYSYISFLLILFTYGMETAYFRFSSTEPLRKDITYSTTLISLLTSTALFVTTLILLADPIANWLKYPKHPEYIIWLSLIIGTDAVSSIFFAQLRQQNKAKRFAALKLINICINIGCNLFFFILCPYLLESSNGAVKNFVTVVYNPDIRIGYVFISNLIAGFITLLLLLPQAAKTKLDFDFLLWKRMLIYALPLLIAGFAGMINETIDRILLKYLSADTTTGLEQVGVYGACYKLSLIMTLFIQTFRYAAEPFFFNQTHNKDSKKIYADVMKYFVICGAIIFLVTTLYIDVLKYFIGEDFRSGLKVVPILLLANLCLGIYFNLSIWYKLTNITKMGAYISIIGAIITLTLNFLLIPKYGYMGAAWTTLICYASMMMISYAIGQKYFPVNYNTKAILLYILLAVFIFIISSYIKPSIQNNLFLLYLVNTALVGAYLLSVYFLERLKKVVP